MGWGRHFEDHTSCDFIFIFLSWDFTKKVASSVTKNDGEFGNCCVNMKKF